MTHSLMRKANARPQVSDLVINWHITEVCNYRCRYCYAEWDGVGRELLHDLRTSVRMLDEVFQYFGPTNQSNPLREHMDWQGVRLNLAGGEPLLYPERVLQLLQAAREMGFTVSMITNGSALSSSLAQRLAPHLSLLGVSLDSSVADTNRRIGRQDNHGALLRNDRLLESLMEVKRLNPELQLKINTVVNALNCDEDLSPLIQQLTPQRWKVLRMLPVLTNDLSVSDSEFLAFVARHRHLGRMLSMEDNTDMVESYLMIDPHGRFFQNAYGQSIYRYSRPIPEIGVAGAFAAVGVIPAKFCARYSNASGDAA
ncbi:viperin family antiviral radical SAM protein [Cupriavidus basilensis]